MDEKSPSRPLVNECAMLEESRLHGNLDYLPVVCDPGSTRQPGIEPPITSAMPHLSGLILSS
ncbi:MAG TPA: hypothetical protein VI386_02345, partial [Candidatus Sulfotelmatobacter sp.]